MWISNRKNIILGTVIVLLIALAGWFFFSLDAVDTPAGSNATPPVVFQVNPGDGFREVAQNLYVAHLIRSSLAFDFFSLVDGRAFTLKPGWYKLSPSMDTPQIIMTLSSENAGEVTVTIPEGSNIYDIDRILSSALVIQPGTFAPVARTQNLEGHLFPDTYQFYTDSSVKEVIQEMTSNFNAKAGPLLANAPTTSTLIIASIIQKEVPDQNDEELVAGIILKRLADGMPLDIDATVCYAKLIENPTSTAQACFLSALDFRINSPYNTYLNKGLPPGSIGNPGTSAVTAALHPKSSPYLYYLSDPATGKTIFARTLDEQNQNRVKYLESN